jgi:hypothetical protein
MWLSILSRVSFHGGRVAVLALFSFAALGLRRHFLISLWDISSVPAVK